MSQPLDTVKVKMQTFPALYKGMSDCLIQSFKKDGIIRGLYAGTLPSIAANVAENSILFAGNTIFLLYQWFENYVVFLFGNCISKGYGACQKLIANIEGHKSVDELSSLR